MGKKQQRIMILGAGQLQIPILQRANERGLYVVVVSPSLNQPGIQYADAVVQYDVREEDAILVEARKYRINGITTDQTDLSVRTAAYVAENMGLPGIGYETSKLFTDKYLQRRKCSELGENTIKYCLVRNLNDAIAFAGETGFPLVMKPIDSQASHGVSKVLNMHELQKYWSEAVYFSREGGVLLEQFIEGPEFPVDSYVIDGKCYLLAIGEYHPFSIKNVFSSYETVWPADQSEETLDLIQRTNKRIIEEFGLSMGRTHAEYIVSDGKCYLVEIGARGGGSYFSSDDIRLITGISSEDFLIDIALGSTDYPVVDEGDRCFCCCSLFFYLPEEGEVVSTEGVEYILGLDYTGRNNLNQIRVGTKTGFINDKGSRYSVVVKADSYEQLEERVTHIRKHLKIKTKVSNGDLRLPIWF